MSRQDRLHRAALSATALLMAGAAAASAAPKTAAPKAGAAKVVAKTAPKTTVDPRKIWPAGLEQLAGRYIFVQVASPGGLWESVLTAEGRSTRRQVSIHEVPPALREKLQNAEIVIGELNTPTAKEADSRLSPSKRGQLRFYTETAQGTLTMRGLPGIGGEDEDTGDYSGPVEFALEHQSHSNPSVTGVLQLRQQQEMTWGVAVVDYAMLSAIAPAPKEPATGKGPQAQGQEHREGPPVITNARVLRSGVEIFSYVEWKETTPEGERVIRGSVRLAKVPPGYQRPSPNGEGPRLQQKQL
jgi:hypothetical protein